MSWPGRCQIDYNLTLSRQRATVVYDSTKTTSTSGRRHLHWWTRGIYFLSLQRDTVACTSTLVNICVDTLTDVISARCFAAVNYADFGDVDVLVLSRLHELLQRRPLRSSMQHPVQVGNKLCRMRPPDYMVFNIRRTEQHVTDSLICLHALASSSWANTVEDSWRLWHIVPLLVYRHLFPHYFTIFTMKTGRSGLRSAASQSLSVSR